MESKPALPEAPAVSAILDQLWVKFLPQMEERVEVLEDAAASLAEDDLTPALWEEAHSAAHKLAGILGTFGLEKGTLLAREAEALLAPGQDFDMTVQHRLAEIAAEIHSLISART